MNGMCMFPRSVLGVCKMRKLVKVAQRLATSVVVLSVLGMGLTVYVNAENEAGLVGVVGAKAKDIAISCGGKYDPQQQVVFHPSLPCGSLVAVMNPINGQWGVAPVVSHTTMFNHRQRVADISPALATAVGLDSKAIAAHKVVIRPLQSWLDHVAMLIPVASQLQPELKFGPEPAFKELMALTRNLFGECGYCTTLGRVAVAQVTLNRRDGSYRGKKTLHDVVYDADQFSWTKTGMNPYIPALRSAEWMQGENLARLMIKGQLSGDALAIQYMVTSEATHYYAFDVIKTPNWGKRNGDLEVVAMSNVVEVDLRHRFFKAKPKGKDTIGLMLASR